MPSNRESESTHTRGDSSFFFFFFQSEGEAVGCVISSFPI
jgi:hypothetical protein